MSNELDAIPYDLLASKFQAELTSVVTQNVLLQARIELRDRALADKDRLIADQSRQISDLLNRPATALDAVPGHTHVPAPQPIGHQVDSQRDLQESQVPQ